MRVAVSYREGQKLKKNATHLKNTLARPPIFDGAYTEKPWIASPGNSVRVTKPSLILLIVQSDKKSKSRQVLKQPILSFFGNNCMRKVLSESKRIKTHCYTRCFIFPSSEVKCITLGHAERAKL